MISLLLIKYINSTQKRIDIEQGRREPTRIDQMVTEIRTRTQEWARNTK